MFSPEVIKGQIYEYLLSDGIEIDKKRYGKFFALGNDDDLLFDIENKFPESAADFTENRGRCVISGPTGGNFPELGKLAHFPLTIACWAIASPDVGFLGEHVTRRIRHWRPEDFPGIGGQCLQNFYSVRYHGPVRNKTNDLFFSVVQLTATVAAA